MLEIAKVTCVEIVPFDPDEHEDFITIVGDKRGCFSSVGRQAGEQKINLQPFPLEVGCFKRFTIVHEFLHALGFFHMQSATDRDEFIEIIWENVREQHKSNFEKYGTNMVSSYDVEYDYGSVLHYSEKAFSIDGSPTIFPLHELKGEKMGQRERLSEKDIRKIKRMYCADKPSIYIYQSDERINEDEETDGLAY